MLIDTSEFDETREKEKIFIFAEGILGFESTKRFIILQQEEIAPFYLLQAVDEELALLCINPFDFFPKYEPFLEAEALEKINAQQETQLLVLNTVVMRENPFMATTNLAAPIIINAKSKQGAQFVLQNSDYKVKQPLLHEKEDSDHAHLVTKTQ